MTHAEPSPAAAAAAAGFVAPGWNAAVVVVSLALAASSSPFLPLSMPATSAKKVPAYLSC